MKLNLVSSSSLVLVNLYPIYGIYFLEWNILKIILLYFIETIIIAIFSLIKIYCMPNEDLNVPVASLKQRLRILSKFLFFLSFWLSIAFVLLNALLFEISNVYSLVSLQGVVLMIISHSISFYTNFISKSEFEKSSMKIIFFKVFFLRIAPIHAFVLLSSSFTDTLLGPLYISIFILCKTAVDLLFHLIEHKNN